MRPLSGEPCRNCFSARMTSAAPTAPSAMNCHPQQRNCAFRPECPVRNGISTDESNPMDAPGRRPWTRPLQDSPGPVRFNPEYGLGRIAASGELRTCVRKPRTLLGRVRAIAKFAGAAALPTTARCSGERHDEPPGLRMPPDGAQVAASRQRARIASSTGSSVNRRIARAVDITSQTSVLTPGMPGNLLSSREHPVAADGRAARRRLRRPLERYGNSRAERAR